MHITEVMFPSFYLIGGIPNHQPVSTSDYEPSVTIIFP